MSEHRLSEECGYALLPGNLTSLAHDRPQQQRSLWASPESDEGLTSASSLSPEPPLNGRTTAAAFAAHQQRRHHQHSADLDRPSGYPYAPASSSLSHPAAALALPDHHVQDHVPSYGFESGVDVVDQGSLAFQASSPVTQLPNRPSKSPHLDLAGNAPSPAEDHFMSQQYWNQQLQQGQSFDSDVFLDYPSFGQHYAVHPSQQQYFLLQPLPPPQHEWWTTTAGGQLMPPNFRPVVYAPPVAPAQIETEAAAQSIVSPGPVRTRKRRQSSKQSDDSLSPESSAAAAWKGRVGPLKESTREKSRSLRQYGACWRCRKYRKPCSNGPEVCETCVTSGFRVWPSTLGCRRGNLELYVDILLPTNAEFVFQSSPLGIHKRQPWRQLVDSDTIAAAKSATALTTQDKRWGILMHKVLGTRIFAKEFVELFEIVATYQQSVSREHPALDATCTMMDATTDFYYTAVHIEGDQTLMNDPIRTIRTIRKSFSRALRLVLNGCLSGRANEWLPCLLSACLLTAAIVCFTDASVQIPADIRQAIWSDMGGMVNHLKGDLRGTIVHLLSALAKGGKPLKMSCWRFEETTDPATGETKHNRNVNGLKLLGNDEPSFDAVAALQSWLERHGEVVNLGRVWTSSQPFSQAQLPAIATMGALFDA